jgi:hypothetical protein
MEPTENSRLESPSTGLMSFAEVFGRLGMAMVTWLCIYAWLVWSAVLHVAECATSGDDLWALVFGFGVLVSMLSPALGLTRPLPEVHPLIMSLAWPLALLVPLAVLPLWDAWSGATLQGESLCSAAPVASWHLWWAPAQTILLSITGWQVWLSCRRVR